MNLYFCKFLTTQWAWISWFQTFSNKETWLTCNELLSWCIYMQVFKDFWRLQSQILFLRKSGHKNHLDNLKLWYKTFLNGLKGLKCIQNIFSHSSSIFKEIWGFKSWLFDFLVFKAKWPLEQLCIIIWNLLE